jgi:hypothetical protein
MPEYTAPTPLHKKEAASEFTFPKCLSRDSKQPLAKGNLGKLAGRILLRLASVRKKKSAGASQRTERTTAFQGRRSMGARGFVKPIYAFVISSRIRTSSFLVAVIPSGSGIRPSYSMPTWPW